MPTDDIQEPGDQGRGDGEAERLTADEPTGRRRAFFQREPVADSLGRTRKDPSLSDPHGELHEDHSGQAENNGHQCSKCRPENGGEEEYGLAPPSVCQTTRRKLRQRVAPVSGGHHDSHRAFVKLLAHASLVRESRT